MACLLWAGSIGLLSGLLLVVSVTAVGRWFAGAGIAVGLMPMAVCMLIRQRSTRWAVVTGAVALIFLGCAIPVISHAPGGVASENAKVQSLYSDGGAHFHRYALGNLLPEVDQFALGFVLMPALDRLLTQSQAKKLKAWTTAIYRELDADDAFRECGSALPLAYDELFGFPSPGHSFLYVPPALDRTKPAPVLIFLHGSGGNFKAYLWLLSRLADRLNFVVLAPSCGMGNWRWPETYGIVDGAIAAAAKHVVIARDNLHVMGLSNGGLGVCQLARDSGARYRSLIFLSPVFDAECIQSEAFAHECQRSRLFILTGGRDDRVPIDYVRENAESMAMRGPSVTFEVEETADHFLLFSHTDRVLASLEKWLRSTQ